MKFKLNYRQDWPYEESSVFSLLIILLLPHNACLSGPALLGPLQALVIWLAEVSISQNIFQETPPPA